MDEHDSRADESKQLSIDLGIEIPDPAAEREALKSAAQQEPAWIEWAQPDLIQQRIDTLFTETLPTLPREWVIDRGYARMARQAAPMPECGRFDAEMVEWVEDCAEYWFPNPQSATDPANRDIADQFVAWIGELIRARLGGEWYNDHYNLDDKPVLYDRFEPAIKFEDDDWNKAIIAFSVLEIAAGQRLVVSKTVDLYSSLISGADSDDPDSADEDPDDAPPDYEFEYDEAAQHDPDWSAWVLDASLQRKIDELFTVTLPGVPGMEPMPACGRFDDAMQQWIATAFNHIFPTASEVYDPERDRIADQFVAWIGQLFVEKVDATWYNDPGEGGHLYTFGPTLHYGWTLAADNVVDMLFEAADYGLSEVTTHLYCLTLDKQELGV
ncbi:MAG: hypothetical protein J2P17_01025 [Mycobacterium sp.]|nr:hypothetical protein [Mycobacterium sp.]